MLVGNERIDGEGSANGIFASFSRGGEVNVRSRMPNLASLFSVS